MLKKRTYMKRDLHTWKQTNTQNQKTSKETYIHDKMRVKDTNKHEKGPVYMKRDPHTWKESLHQKIHYIKRDLHPWKETRIHEKRPTYMKRDPHTRKESLHNKIHCIKRDLHPWKLTSMLWKKQIWKEACWRYVNTCGVATISRLLKIVGLFCKTAL